jgi:hypothetical protein
VDLPAEAFLYSTLCRTIDFFVLRVIGCVRRFLFIFRATTFAVFCGETASFILDWSVFSICGVTQATYTTGTCDTIK